MNKKSAIIISAIVLLLVAGGYLMGGSNQQKANRVADSDLDQFTDISLMDYEGNEVTLADFRGQPLVINSWATWCPFCLAELPDFGRLQAEFSDEIIVIAINRRQSIEGIKSYTDDVGVTDKLLFLRDGDDSFYRSIGGFAMPETLFIDGDGEIVVHKRGPMELVEMREHVQKIVNTY
jgi:thiol-disulfide isomerase/thioredoxin